jgi:tetratricopeptide (TPR) repeat protein
MFQLGSLLGEIHRRSVWQILGSYAVGAWIILQLAETLAGLIGLPLWFGPTVVTLTVIGFPLVILTSFLQGGKKGRKDGEGEGKDGSGKALLRKIFSWRNAAIAVGSVVVLLGVGTVGYNGMRTAGLGPIGSLIAKDILETDEKLILAEFADRTPDGSLGETVTALFRIDLAQATSVRLAEPTQLAPALARMQRDPSEPLTQAVALELAQREGIKGVIAGEVLPLGSGAVISARLVTAEGETLVAVDQTARDVADVPQAVDALSAQLRERIGDPLRNIQGDPPLHEVTTSSLEALRKYAQSDRANDQGDWQRAVTLLEEALAQDSTFAMAWRKMGILFQNEERDPDRARTSLERAFHLRDRLTDRERYLTEAAYFTYVEEDEQRAMQAYETVLESYPNDRIALNNLAVAYGGQGNRERAAEIYLQAIRSGAAPAVTYGNAVETLFDLGKGDTAIYVIDRFEEAYPENPEAYRLGGVLMSSRFEYPAAEDQIRAYLELVEGDPAREAEAILDLASLALLQGRYQEGLDRLIEVFERQELMGVRFIRQPRPIFEGMANGLIRSSMLQDDEGAITALDAGWAARPLDPSDPAELAHLELAEAYALAGRPDRARELLAEYETTVAPEVRESPDGRSNVLIVLGNIAMAEGRSDDALRDFREAREAVPDCTLCVLTELGQAYAASDRHQEAVDVFEEYLNAPVFSRLRTDNIKMHVVLIGLAESHEALGQNEKAAEYYGRMLEIWSDAEPGLLPRVEELRAALRRVGGE